MIGFFISCTTLEKANTSLPNSKTNKMHPIKKLIWPKGVCSNVNSKFPNVTNASISPLIGCILFVLLLGKLVFAFPRVVQEMKNPIIASVSPTFTMGTLSLSNGLHFYEVNESVIHTIWVVAAILQFIIILYFIKSFIWNKKVTMANIFPSWLIVFVGTAVMPLTAGDLSSRFTQGIVLFAMVAFIILVPIIIVRGFIRKDLPEPTIPMLTILSAPASLSLASYFKQFDSTMAVVITLFVIERS